MQSCELFESYMGSKSLSRGSFLHRETVMQITREAHKLGPKVGQTKMWITQFAVMWALQDLYGLKELEKELLSAQRNCYANLKRGPQFGSKSGSDKNVNNSISSHVSSSRLIWAERAWEGAPVCTEKLLCKSKTRPTIWVQKWVGQKCE